MDLEATEQAQDETDERGEEVPSMLNILLNIEDIKDKDQEFIDILVNKLPLMMITWEQPWYQKSHCLTRRLKESDDETDESFRKDKISKAESDKIEKNWRKFVKKYDIPNKPMSFARWKSHVCRNPKVPTERARRMVTAHLARGLERTLHQVYKHFTNKHAYIRKRPYSAEEENTIKLCLENYPHKAVSILSCVLHREPRQIYNKIKLLNNGKVPTTKPKRWNLERASKLVNLLITHTQLSLEELKDRQFESSVWIAIDKEMNHGPQLIRRYWYRLLHVQLFVQRDIKINKLRKKLLKRLCNTEYQIWSDIRWKDIVKEFPDGCTPEFLYYITLKTFATVPKVLRSPLEELIETGLDKLASHKLKNRRLKRLKLNKEGFLEVIPYIKYADENSIVQK